MKFWTNVIHGVEKLWLKFGDLSTSRFGVMDFSLDLVSAEQFWRVCVLLALVFFFSLFSLCFLGIMQEC